MPVGIEAWVTQIPPVTRAWLALSVLTSVAVVSESLAWDKFQSILMPIYVYSNAKLSHRCSCILVGRRCLETYRYIPTHILFKTFIDRTSLQLWRVFTNFFYFGSLSLDFVFHMFFLCVLSRSRLVRSNNRRIVCDTVAC